MEHPCESQSVEYPQFPQPMQFSEVCRDERGRGTKVDFIRFISQWKQDLMYDSKLRDDISPLFCAAMNEVVNSFEEELSGKNLTEEVVSNGNLVLDELIKRFELFLAEIKNIQMNPKNELIGDIYNRFRIFLDQTGMVYRFFNERYDSSWSDNGLICLKELIDVPTSNLIHVLTLLKKIPVQPTSPQEREMVLLIGTLRILRAQMANLICGLLGYQLKRGYFFNEKGMRELKQVIDDFESLLDIVEAGRFYFERLVKGILVAVERNDSQTE